MSEPFGRYQLLKRIAGGGMGEVFLARQSGIQGFEKLLVIKTLLPNLTEDNEFVSMFLDEARIAARLAHPNVVQIFDLGEEGEVYYIAMEYVHGEDVKRIWKQAYHKKEVIPVPLAARIIADAAAGLGYAHRLSDQDGKLLGVVHRDVSPQNILVTFDGGVKLIDFGVAKAAGRMTRTQTGALKGKYAYMSPEQVEGEELDQRSDIFALGIVLWEMVTGSRLFRADSDVATLKAVSRCDVVPPSEQNANVPPELDPIVMKALARDRDQRYPTAEDLRLDLENWIARTAAQGSAAHLSAFMRKLFDERLTREGSKGPLADVDPNAHGFAPGSTSSGRRSPSESDSRSLVPRKRTSGGQSKVDPETRTDPKLLIVGSALAVVLLVGGAFATWKHFHADVVPSGTTGTDSSLNAPTGSTAPTANPAQALLAHVEVVSMPSGALLKIDGHEHGTTPVRDLALDSGKEVQIELEKEGFQPLSRQVLLKAGEQHLDYTLTAAQVVPAAARVHIESDPEGAKVFNAGQQIGITPFDWQTEATPSPVTLTFKLANYRVAESEVVRGRDPNVSVHLSRQAKANNNNNHGTSTGGTEPLDIKTGR
jgi:serine/threonine protein kinase